MNFFLLLRPRPAARAWHTRGVLLAAGAMFSIASYAQQVPASGLDSLENFVKTTQSGRAVFAQVVTGPAKAGQVAKTKTSSGTFEFLRPNRFKFVYQKPFEQSKHFFSKALVKNELQKFALIQHTFFRLLNENSIEYIVSIIRGDFRKLRGKRRIRSQDG